MRKIRPGQPRPASDPSGKPGFRRPPRQRRPKKEETPPAIAESMRIAKAMARAGLCSRRDAERWILEGRVAVNGEILKSPARDVGPADKVVVDGNPLVRPEPAMLWRFHKPRGCVTTHRDPEGRPTVFEKLPADMPRVISIGRLDFNTEGLLLLTTDGGLARHFELPSTGWARRYRVRANGSVTQEQIDALKDGVEIDGVRYGPIEGIVDRVQGANVWLTLGIREGKNREVRKILGSLGLEVNRLIRVSFGPFQLLDLEEGQVERVKRRVLAEQLGPKLTREFGLDVIQPEEKGTKNTGFVARKPQPDTANEGKKPFGKTRSFADRGKPREGDRAERGGAGEHVHKFEGGKPFRSREAEGDRRPLRDRKSDGDRAPTGDRKPPRDRKPFAGKRDDARSGAVGPRRADGGGKPHRGGAGPRPGGRPGFDRGKDRRPK